MCMGVTLPGTCDSHSACDSHSGSVVFSVGSSELAGYLLQLLKELNTLLSEHFTELLLGQNRYSELECFVIFASGGVAGQKEVGVLADR